MKTLSSVPRGIRSSAVIFVSSFISSALGLVTVPVFTRLMTTAEYGEVSLYNSWLSIITVFATLSLSAGIYQVALNEYPDDRDTFTFSVLVLSNISTIVVFGVILSFGDFFSSLFSLEKELLVLMGAYLMTNPAMQLWLARAKYELRPGRVALVSILSSFFSQTAAVLAVLLVKGCNLGKVRIISASLVTIGFSVLFYLYTAERAKWKVKRQYMKYALCFNLPLVAHYLAQYVLRSTDKIMITSILGKDATGIYSLASTVANVSILAWGAMSASLTPYIYSHIRSGEYGKVSRAAVSVEAVFGLVCVLVSLVGPEIILILGSEKYIEGAVLIPPIAASSFLNAVYSFYSDVEFYHHKTVSTAFMTVAAAAVNIVLNFVFIPRFGYTAAAYTTEAAYLFYTFLHYVNYRRIAGKERIYDDRAVFLLAFMTTAFCILPVFLYSHAFIRYLLLALCIISCFLMKDRIMDVMTSLSSVKED